MEKEKQIEEMSRKIDEMYNVYDTTAGDIAEGLYETGYGNVKEAVKEFAERVKGIFSGNAEERQKGYAKEIVCPLTIDEFNEEIDELIEEVRGE